VSEGGDVRGKQKMKKSFLVWVGGCAGDRCGGEGTQCSWLVKKDRTHSTWRGIWEGAGTGGAKKKKKCSAGKLKRGTRENGTFIIALVRRDWTLVSI